MFAIFLKYHLSAGYCLNSGGITTVVIYRLLSIVAELQSLLVKLTFRTMTYPTHPQTVVFLPVLRENQSNKAVIWHGDCSALFCVEISIGNLNLELTEREKRITY